MTVFQHLDFDAHETVVFAHDEPSGLNAIIAIHSSALGPAAGGCRVWTYPTEGAGLADALRLSRGMTFKNAAAGLDLGGGKAVIMLAEGQKKTPELMRAFGRAVERLNGAYTTAEDVGVTPADMAEVRSQTRHVAGLATGAHASGDPSPVTATGVFQSIRTGVREVTGREDLAGLHVAVQGLGHVGTALCDWLAAAGAQLTVADIAPARCEEARTRYGATVVAPDRIHATDCDVFAPCALGGVLSEDTIPELRARLVAGAANNQLARDDLDTALAARGITYLPDFVVNAGGIMNVAAEIAGVDDPNWVKGKLDGLQERVTEILRRAKASGKTPQAVAVEMVRERLAAAGERSVASEPAPAT